MGATVPENSLPEPVLGEASPVTAPDAPAATQEVPKPKPGRVTWVGYVIPISIVLIASIGIFVGYRAERHAGAAAESDQAAISASLTAQRLYADSLVEAEGAQADYEQWADLEQAGLEQSNPWCNHDPTTAANFAYTEIIISCELAQAVASDNLPGYGQPKGFNVSQYSNDVQAVTPEFAHVDTDSQGALTSADQDRVAERRMLAIGVSLSLALALCTIAQQAYRRQWRAGNRYLSLYLAVPGWIAALVCVALVVTWKA
jgi:hypothetical protein